MMSNPKKKLWSKMIEEEGTQIRLYERAKGGPIWMSVVTGQTKDENGRTKTEKFRKSMEVKDRATAEALARETAQELARNRLLGRAPTNPTVEQVFDLYFLIRAPEMTTAGAGKMRRAGTYSSGPGVAANESMISPRRT